MKRFLEWWSRPQLHIHFVEPRKRTNPLAEEAIDSLKPGVDCRSGQNGIAKAACRHCRTQARRER